MTEAEWLASAAPIGMLQFLADVYDRLSPRKLRLFAAYCCRNVLHPETEPEVRHAVEMLEQFAEGQITDVQFWATHAPVAKIWLFYFGTNMISSAAFHMTECAIRDPLTAAIHAAYYSGEAAHLRCGTGNRETEKALQAAWVRDIFPSPYRRKFVDRDWFRWNDGTAASLARQMYEARDFFDMPILADALEDAGCGCADMIDHCRDRHTAHVRGCWVVDLILGKT
jgi:hypothetical protein